MERAGKESIHGVSESGMSLLSKIMKDARSPDNPCIKCQSTGTTCGRHYNGIRQHRLGKGRGIKCHPLLVADLCAQCDEDFQEGSVPKSDHEWRTAYSEEFLFLCALSSIRRIERGVLK